MSQGNRKVIKLILLGMSFGFILSGARWLVGKIDILVKQIARIDCHISTPVSMKCYSSKQNKIIDHCEVNFIECKFNGL